MSNGLCKHDRNPAGKPRLFDSFHLTSRDNTLLGHEVAINSLTSTPFKDSRWGFHVGGTSLRVTSRWHISPVSASKFPAFPGQSRSLHVCLLFTDHWKNVHLKGVALFPQGRLTQKLVFCISCRWRYSIKRCTNKGPGNGNLDRTNRNRQVDRWTVGWENHHSVCRAANFCFSVLRCLVSSRVTTIFT